MHGWKPTSFESTHPFPVHLVALSPTPKRTKPEPFELVAEGSEPLFVAGDGVVAEVASDYASEPPPLVRDGFMTTTLELQL